MGMRKRSHFQKEGKEMKKILIGVLLTASLFGCSSKSEPTATPETTVTPTVETTTETTATEEPAASEQAAAPVETTTVECVVEADVPSGLTVTIQDGQLIFSKDPSYSAETFQVGDVIDLTYAGELGDNPVAISAVKK